MPDHPPDHPETPGRRPWMGGPVAYRGAGLTVRAYTADQLRARLGHPAPAAPALSAVTPPRPSPVPAAAVVAPGGNRAGASALAEYRRRRAAELTQWTAGLPWRAALITAAGLAGWQLAAHAALPRSWVAGLLSAAGAAWQLRFRASQPTRAWRDGARGERATARRLRHLEHDGYVVLHDLEVPGSHANLDHVAVGPAGVFVIDSKRYRGRLSLGSDGMLWYAGYPLAQQLATVVWATMRLADALQLPPEVPVRAVMVVHRAPVPFGELTVAGVQVIPPCSLAQVLGREAVLPATQVALIAGQATARLRPAA